METKDHQKKIKILTQVARASMPKLPYHNFNHAMGVYSAVNDFALLGNVEYKNRFLLKTAALLHDIIFVPGKKDNEEKSSEFAISYLQKIGYSREQAQSVGKLILATKMPQNPGDYLERLLCDADLNHLGKSNFFEQGEKLRIELGLLDSNEWYHQELEFLKGHKYHTGIAKRLRNSGKATNIQKLEKMLQEAKC